MYITNSLLFAEVIVAEQGQPALRKFADAVKHRCQFGPKDASYESCVQDGRAAAPPRRRQFFGCTNEADDPPRNDLSLRASCCASGASHHAMSAAVMTSQCWRVHLSVHRHRRSTGRRTSSGNLSLPVPSPSRLPKKDSHRWLP